MHVSRLQYSLHHIPILDGEPNALRGRRIAMSRSSPLSLPTLFVPPNSCFTHVYWYSFISGQPPQPAGTTVVPNVPNSLYLGLPGSSNCLPTSWAPSSYYSPGICPGGYTIACSTVSSVETVTETIATCCPRQDELFPAVLFYKYIGLIVSLAWLVTMIASHRPHLTGNLRSHAQLCSLQVLPLPG